jgi:putative ABC transport system permease protein
VLLLLAQVQVGMRQRHQELVVWRTLGAGTSAAHHAVGEFALLGLVAGLVAAIGAERAGGAAEKVFDFPWSRTGGCG